MRPDRSVVARVEPQRDHGRVHAPSPLRAHLLELQRDMRREQRLRQVIAGERRGGRAQRHFDMVDDAARGLGAARVAARAIGEHRITRGARAADAQRVFIGRALAALAAGGDDDVEHRALSG